MHRVETQLGGRTFSLETGELAGQADGAVVARYGDTTLLATVVCSSPRQGLDFFPLQVEFEERAYSIGRIPGSVLRREGRPPLSGILAGRLADRCIRPLFPDGMRNDTQIVLTLLTHDGENEPDVMGIVAASAALMLTGLPFEGPVGALRVGLDGDELVANAPIDPEGGEPALDLVVAGTREGVVMLEAGAQVVPDDTVVRAINWGQEQLQGLVDIQLQLKELAGKPARDVDIIKPADELVEAVRERYGSRIQDAARVTDRAERKALLGAVTADAEAELGEDHEAARLDDALHDVEAEAVRALILNEGIRPDGRDESSLRKLSARVGVLPRIHGTGLFQRGETQVLAVTTLGTPRDVQRIGLTDLEAMAQPKRFIHHYNMPPYASGETGRLGSPKRREVGHGALAERAIAPVLPDLKDFPYTMRVVSEVLSSNGSTSMASTCGSTLSLMDAGVPLKAPVAGISIGMIAGDDGRFTVLTDIQGAEDHFGDMDFKVAGTAEGVTAVQVDIKIKRLTPEMIEAAVQRAREARMQILDVMRVSIAEPRADVGEFAPKITQISISPDSIGAVIGPGGKMIRRLEAETGASIDIEEDGTVTVGGATREGTDRAVQMIKDLTGEVEIGRTVLGKVTRIMNFGAFVEIVPGKEGLVPINELAEEPVGSVNDVVAEGDDIMVMVVEVDHLGRINLSRRAVLQDLTPAETLATAPPRPGRDGPRGGGRRDGGRRDGPGGRGGGRRGRPPRGGRRFD